MKFKYLALAAVAITAISTTSANAALTIGDQISVQFFAPDLNSPDGPPNIVTYSGAGQVVGDNNENQFILSDNSITLGFFDELNSYNSASFNGPILKNLTNSSAFTGWTVASDTIDISRFFITGNSLGANLQGLNIFPSTLATFSGPVAAVPEPGTWAMMLAGFGMIGFAARRRQSVKTTVRFA